MGLSKRPRERLRCTIAEAILRALLRNESAAAVGVLLGALIVAAGTPFDPAGLVTQVVFLRLSVFVLIRFGLLAMLANYVIHSLLTHFPLTTEGSAWCAGISLAGILLIATIVFYGFYNWAGDPFSEVLPSKSKVLLLSRRARRGSG